MKRILTFTLALTLLLGLAACGAVNETDVYILWSGEGKVLVPNSLINAMDRAMYIENISYQYYGANGDQAKQTAQVQEALNAGAAVLMVEPVDVTAAQSISARV